MEISEHLGFLADEGAALVAAASDADPLAAIPGCPDWTVRELLGHIGGVHRWATAVVAGGLERPDLPLAEPPGDAELVGWVGEGLGALLDTLAAAPPDLSCFTFLPAASPLAFWARRQALETAIHRLDVEGAIGATRPVDAALAADGIAELVTGFAARPKAHEPATLRLDPTDSPGWLLRLGDGVQAWPAGRGSPADRDADAAAVDAVVTGSSDAVFRWVWNRPAEVTVSGDASVAERWKRIRVRWA